jgi:predicted small lipoprotein YifL
MKLLLALSFLAVLAACGTRPPLPPECEGELTPINTSSSISGISNEARSGT